MLSAEITDSGPPEVIRQGLNGSVDITVMVDVSGSVKACSVTKSSGQPALDRLACEGYLRYARYVPAQDASGKAVEGQSAARITFHFGG